MSAPIKPMAKKVLLVEGNDERDLCSLLISKKLGLKCISSQNIETFIKDNDTVHIIPLNKVDNKSNITSFMKSPNYIMIL